MTRDPDGPADPDSANQDRAGPDTPAWVHRDGDDGNITMSSDTPHVVYNPLPNSHADSVRKEKAVRRMEHRRSWPRWMKKLLWFAVPTYGLMRRNDPNYEEHYEQWRERVRRDYDEGEAR